MKQFSYWISWVAMASVAALACYKLPSSGDVTQLRAQVAALQEQIESASKQNVRSPLQPLNVHNTAARRTAEPDQLKTTTATDSTTTHDIADTAELTALLQEVGLQGTLRPEDLRSPAVPVAAVGQHLLDSFSTSAVAQHAAVTYTGCNGSSCTMDVTFSNVRAAVEQEPQLHQWLAGVDSSCSFTLGAAALQDRDADSVRHVVVTCG